MITVFNSLKRMIQEAFQYDLLPSEADLRKDFPHLMDCQARHVAHEDDLIHEAAASRYESLQTHWLSFSVPMKRKYLRCRHCGARAEYAEMPVS
jgi:hypothetical protein